MVHERPAEHVARQVGPTRSRAPPPRPGRDPGSPPASSGGPAACRARRTPDGAARRSVRRSPRSVRSAAATRAGRPPRARVPRPRHGLPRRRRRPDPDRCVPIVGEATGRRSTRMLRSGLLAPIAPVPGTIGGTAGRSGGPPTIGEVESAMVDVHDPPTAAALADADELVAAAGPSRRSGCSPTVNRRHRDPVVETRLVDLRHRAFDTIGPPTGELPATRHRITGTCRPARGARRPPSWTWRPCARGCPATAASWSGD